MIAWHEKLFVRIGLRIAGMAFLASAWFEGVWLQNMVVASPHADASGAQIVLAALMFASASAGLLLTFVGAGLWKPVAVSDRWATSIPTPAAGDPAAARLLNKAHEANNIKKIQYVRP